MRRTICIGPALIIGLFASASADAARDLAGEVRLLGGDALLFVQKLQEIGRFCPLPARAQQRPMTIYSQGCALAGRLDPSSEHEVPQPTIH